MFDDKTIKTGKRLIEIYAISITVILLFISFFYSGISHLLHHKIFYKSFIAQGFPDCKFSLILTYLIAICELLLSSLILIPMTRKFSAAGLIILILFNTVVSIVLLIKNIDTDLYLYGFSEPISTKPILKGVAYLLFAIYLFGKSNKNGS